MIKLWKNIRIFLWMTVLTGLFYPLMITGIAQLAMKHQADGALLQSKGKIIGAELIGQKFESVKYFWGRPSAIEYNPLPSGGSNLGPTSLALKKLVAERKARILQAHSDAKTTVPSELLFASGSGIDPDISIKAAYFQMERIAKERGIDEKEISALIDRMVIGRGLGFIGVPRVNVLRLNLALDTLKQP